MKHRQDYLVTFNVKIIDSTKILRFSESNHFRLKELAIKICKNLNQDRFNTNISFFDSSSHQLDIIYTLQQLRIRNQDTLYAKVVKSRIIAEDPLVEKISLLNNPSAMNTHYQKTSKNFIEEAEQTLATIDTKKLNNKEYAGLNPIVSCVNRRCIAFQKLVVANLGLNTFDLLSVFNSIYCPMCPHKGISKRCMMVHKAVLKACMWNVDGYIEIPNGPLKPENLNNRRFTIEKEDENVVSSIYAMGRWVKCIFTVRGLVEKPYFNSVRKITKTAKTHFAGYLFGHDATVCSILAGISTFENGDDSVLISSSFDKKIIMWKIRGMKGHQFDVSLKHMNGHQNAVKDLVLSNNKHFMLSSSYDSTVRIWDLTNQKCVREIKQHTKEVMSAVWSHDDKSIYSGGADIIMNLYDSKNGYCKSTSQSKSYNKSNHTDSVSKIRYSPCNHNEYLATIGFDGRLK